MEKISNFDFEINNNSKNPQTYRIKKNDDLGRITWNIEVDLDTENLDEQVLDSELYKGNLSGDFNPKTVTSLSIKGANKIAQYDYSEYYNLRSLSIKVPAGTPTPSRSYYTTSLLNSPSLNNLYIEATPEFFGSQSLIVPESLKEIKYHNPETSKDYVLPTFMFNRDFDGIPLSKRIELSERMSEQGIPLTEYNIKSVMQAYHDGRDAAISKIDNYKAFGFLNLNTQKDDTKVKELTEGFIQKHGRAPRITEDVAVMAQENNYNIPVSQIIEKFDLKRTASYLRNGIPASVGSLLMTTLDKDEYDKAIKSPYYNQITELLGEYWKNGKDEKYLNLAKFISNHPRANKDLINDILEYSAVIYLDSKANTRQAQAELSRASSFSEIAKIETRYKDFRFSDCKFDLKFHDTEMGNLVAGIMRPGDMRMANIGYDTHCCQHLGGAGETAMMYGFVADKAGFWTIEDKDSHKIYAQAEIWEQNDNTLVFDNIEFANDRDISGFLPIIGKWAKESGYENILMGNGYNNVKKNTLVQQAGIAPPITEKVRKIVGDNIYTDASHGVSVIKERGEVSEFFNENGQLFEEKRGNDRENRDNAPSKVDAYLEKYEHYDALAYAKELYDQIDFDNDPDEILDQYQYAKAELTENVISNMDQAEVMANYVESAGAPPELLGPICGAAKQQLLDTIDNESVALNAVLDAFSERYNKSYISEKLVEKIKDNIDLDSSANDILDACIEELEAEGFKVDEDGNIKDTEKLRIENIKVSSDFYIDDFDNTIIEAIDNEAADQTEMIYYNEMADFLRANYSLVESTASEFGTNIDNFLDDAYDNQIEDFVKELNDADGLLMGAFGLMRAEELFDTEQPMLDDVNFSDFEDFGLTYMLENVRDNMIEELQALKLFDIKINDIPVSEALEGFEPQALEEVEVSADFYAVNGAKLSTSCKYEFGKDIQDVRSKLAANFINMSPEDIAESMNIPEEERQEFIDDIQTSLNTLEANYKYNIPKNLLNKYKEPILNPEIEEIQQFIDENFLSKGKSVEEVRDFIASIVPKDYFEVNDIGEFSFIGDGNVDDLSSKILVRNENDVVMESEQVQKNASSEEVSNNKTAPLSSYLKMQLLNSGERER